jgi:hypothetical protein
LQVRVPDCKGHSIGDDGKVYIPNHPNFTEAGQERNIEIGLLVKSCVLAEKVECFFRTLVDSGYFGQGLLIMERAAGCRRVLSAFCHNSPAYPRAVQTWEGTT